MIGNETNGTILGVGALSLAAGAQTIQVDYLGGIGGTELGFNNGGSNFSLRGATGMTVNFVGTGGTLGSAGANPRIIFTGAGVPFTGTGGLLSNTLGGTTVGWATVNTTSWATVTGNAITALAPTITSGTNVGIQAGTSASITLFNPTVDQTLTANAAAAAFRLAPNGSTTLSLGTSAITTAAFMYSGSGGFTIAGTGAASVFGTLNATRYLYVTDPTGVLTLGKVNPSDTTTVNLAASQNPLSKSGPGTLYLNGNTNQVLFTSVQNINIIQGALRVTSSSIGGFASNNSPFTTFNLRGGVLELDGGGSVSAVSFVRFNGAGTSAGGAVNFDGGTGATGRGDGGFSAINAPAGVNITIVDTVAGATPAVLQWNSTSGATTFFNNGYAFTLGSANSNSLVNFTNNIQLDNGSPSTSYQAREVRVAQGQSGSSARLSGVLSGTSSTDLVKTGAGTLELTGSNTYAGNTLVTAGTLRVNNISGSGTGTGNVVVSSGATLGGTGTISGDVYVNGGTIAPGNSPGRLTVNGTVNFSSSSTFNVEINGGTTAGTDYDQLRVGAGGSLNLNGATLTATLGFTPVGTEKIFITDDLFAGNLTGTFNGYAEGSSITIGAYTGTISYLGDFSTLNTFGGNDIVIFNLGVSIPEPGTIALLGLTGFFGLQWYLRRKPAVAKKDDEKGDSETTEPVAPVEVVA
ncbi:MAG: autotransporter-associated beta strand repeat-containing protein [Gemmatales bacterium]